MTVRMSLLYIVGATVAVAGALLYSSSRRALSEPAHPRESMTSRPAQEFANSTVHYRIEKSIDYSKRQSGGLPDAAEQSDLITDRWVEIGPSGSAVRFLTITRKPDGTLWQESAWAGGPTKDLTWFRRPPDGAACTTQMPIPPGQTSSLPLVAPDAPLAAGWKEAAAVPDDLVRAGVAAGEDVRTFARPGPSEPGATPRTRSTILIDAGTGQVRGDFVFARDEAGNEALIESRVYSPITRVSSFPEYSPSALGECEGSPAPVTDDASAGSGSEVATPAPVR